MTKLATYKGSSEGWLYRKCTLRSGSSSFVSPALSLMGERKADGSAKYEDFQMVIYATGYPNFFDGHIQINGFYRDEELSKQHEKYLNVLIMITLRREKW